MNQITEAFMKAGVKAPSVKERLWQHIRANQGHTAHQIAKVLRSIPSSTIASQLSDMERRGMVFVKGAKAATTWGRSTVKAYHSDMTTYELLPVLAQFRRDKPAALIKAPVATTPAPTPSAAPQAPAAAPAAPQFNLEALTLAEARALYLQLHKMFGG